MKAKYPNLKSIKAFYRRRRGKIILFALFTLLASGISLAFPLMASKIIINLTGGIYGEMVKFAFILFGCIAFGAVFDYIAAYLYSNTSNALFFDIRRQVAYKTISMNLSAVYEKGSGFFLERLNEDSREASAVHLNIYRQIINLAVNLGFIGYIAALNWMLGLLFAAGLVILVFLEYFRVSKNLLNMKKQKRAIEKVKANEAELLKGLKEIKGIGARDAIIERHSAVSGGYIGLRYKREMFGEKMQGGINLVKAAIDLAVLLFAGLYLLPNKQTLLAAVLVVYNFKGNIYGLIAGLAKIKDIYVNGELASRRINDILRAPENEADCFGEGGLDGEIETIEFKGVTFGYTKERPILNDVNFKIDGAGVIGFVGKSGSGKSTIFSLLTNFYKAGGGKVLINGIDVTTLSEDAVRGGITPVLQESYMFNDTVMNNILFARPDATEEEVFAACAAAQIHDEILAMKDGYNTLIGENGATVSGGQKQRLEIARALLKNTRVLLFDEATSALDKNNLNLINDLMIELGKTKIVLVIAHRLGIMRRCDKVVVLDGGKVIAADKHDRLIETCGYYAELFNKSANTENNKPA